MAMYVRPATTQSKTVTPSSPCSARHCLFHGGLYLDRSGGGSSGAGKTDEAEDAGAVALALRGLQLTDATLLIEDRAISLSKGCYVGQEVIIRVLHRGHGRVAKKLVTLRMQGESPQEVPASGARLFSEARDVGWVTTAASSPQLGPIALGYVHRDFVVAGTRLEVETRPGRVAAVVRERSISSAAL